LILIHTLHQTQTHHLKDHRVWKPYTAVFHSGQDFPVLCHREVTGCHPNDCLYDSRGFPTLHLSGNQAARW